MKCVNDTAVMVAPSGSPPFQGKPWLLMLLHDSARKTCTPAGPGRARSKHAEAWAQWDGGCGWSILCMLLHGKANHSTSLMGGTVILFQNPTTNLPRCKLSHSKPLVKLNRQVLLKM